MQTLQSDLDFELISSKTDAKNDKFKQKEPDFRPIHYLGSKLRIVGQIATAIDEVDPSGGPVLDLFAGSGTVSMALSSQRRVFASDIQEYSRVICSALIGSTFPDIGIVDAFKARLEQEQDYSHRLSKAIEPITKHEVAALTAALIGDVDPICDLLDHGSLLAQELGASVQMSTPVSKPIKETLRRLRKLGLHGSAKVTALRYFGGAYFSYAQAAELDFLAHVISSFESNRRDVLFAALLSTASDIVNTVGKQFAQPIRPRNKDGTPKRHLITKIARDRAVSPSGTYFRWLNRYAGIKPAIGENLAIRADYSDALELLKGKFSVVYADPPYTRDHYSRFYHVLETLALRDNPAIAKNPGAIQGELSRGLYRVDRHQSPFCIKTQVHGAFLEMFKQVSAQDASLVLSYSPFDGDTNARPRLMSVPDIAILAAQFYVNVEVRAVDGVSHSKLNHTRLNYEIPPDAEVMFICSGQKS